MAKGKTTTQKKKNIVVKKTGSTLKKPVISEFAMTAKLNNISFDAKGKTFFLCLDDMKKKVDVVVKSRVEFVVNADGKVSRTMLFPFQLKKLLSDKIVREIFQKKMMNALK